MTLKKLALKQLAHFEALRRLGFSSDDIYPAFYNGGELFTELRQGEKRFRITISKGVRVNTEEYAAMWPKEVARYQALPIAECARVYNAEFTTTKLLALATALLDKGFDVTRVSRRADA